MKLPFPMKGPGPVVLSEAKLVTAGSTAWYDEPLSGEKLWADQHYRDFARDYFGPRAVGHSMLNHRRALCKQQKTPYSRPDVTEQIALLLSMKQNKLDNLLRRSSRWQPKRRKIFVSK
jgi:hypothetical protein